MCECTGAGFGCHKLSFRSGDFADAEQAAWKSSVMKRARTVGLVATQRACRVRSSTASRDEAIMPSLIRCRTAGSAIRALVSSLIFALRSGLLIVARILARVSGEWLRPLMTRHPDRGCR